MGLAPTSMVREALGKSMYREFQQHLQNDFPEPLVFVTLAQTKALSRQWLEEYNGVLSTRTRSAVYRYGNSVRDWSGDKSIINKMKLPENLTLEVD